jgi:hypothetical protein
MKKKKLKKLFYKVQRTGVELSELDSLSRILHNSLICNSGIVKDSDIVGGFEILKNEIFKIKKNFSDIEWILEFEI